MIKVATIQEAVDLIHANAVPKGETVYVVAPPNLITVDVSMIKRAIMTSLTASYGPWSSAPVMSEVSIEWIADDIVEQLLRDRPDEGSKQTDKAACASPPSAS